MLRVNCNVNYGLWVIMLCQCRLMSCSKCTILVRDVDNAGSRACVQTGGNGKSLYLPLNLAVNLKLV